MVILGAMRIALLPGLDGTGRLFRPFLDHLPDGWDATVISYPPDPDLQPDDLLACVDESLGDSRCTLVAESFSGPLAVRYAERRPEAVDALVLCASFLRNPAPAVLRHLLRLARGWYFRLPFFEPLACRVLCDAATPAAVKAALRAVLRDVPAAVLAARVRSLAVMDSFDALARLVVPVLYLGASRDRVVGGRGARQIRLASPHAVIRVIEGPHFLLQSRPAECLAAVRAFCAEVGAIPPSGNSSALGCDPDRASRG